MIQRQLLYELLHSAKDYPVVTVIGPRQAGKTTLVKMAFPDYDYCNLENPEIRDFSGIREKASAVRCIKILIVRDTRR